MTFHEAEVCKTQVHDTLRAGLCTPGLFHEGKVQKQGFVVSTILGEYRKDEGWDVTVAVQHVGLGRESALDSYAAALRSAGYACEMRPPERSEQGPVLVITGEPS